VHVKGMNGLSKSFSAQTWCEEFHKDGDRCGSPSQFYHLSQTLLYFSVVSIYAHKGLKQSAVCASQHSVSLSNVNLQEDRHQYWWRLFCIDDVEEAHGHNAEICCIPFGWRKQFNFVSFVLKFHVKFQYHRKAHCPLPTRKTTSLAGKHSFGGNIMILWHQLNKRSYNNNCCNI